MFVTIRSLSTYFLLSPPLVLEFFTPRRFSAGAAQAGEPVLLDSIAAVVIGGASLFGGSGTIVGTVIGALIIAVIQYGLVFVNVEPFWQFVAVGVVIIISVLVDQVQKQVGKDGING